MKCPKVKIVWPQGIKVIKAQCPVCLDWVTLNDPQLFGCKPMVCMTELCDFYVTIPFYRIEPMPVDFKDIPLSGGGGC